MRPSRIMLNVVLGMSLALAGFYAAASVHSQTPSSAPQSAAVKAALAPIPGGTYMIDPTHSSINFSVRHFGINSVRGRFTDFAGTIHYDDADVTKSSVEFTAKVSSITTDAAKRDEHLRTADFFDVAKYPEMTFKSTRIERKGHDDFVADGDFTLRGVTKQIAIPFKLSGAFKDPRGGTHIGIEAGLTINRQDYGVSWNQTLDGGGLAVGNDVRIDLALEAVKHESKTTAASK